MTDKSVNPDPMQLGMVGLGRMGANIVRRLMAAGHECVVYDVNAEAVSALADEGAVPAADLADLAARLTGPRHVWIMVPAGITARVIRDVAAALSPGDTVIDGGNSHYRDDIAMAAELRIRDIDFVDVGTSGGVFGRERGYCLMIGGPDAPVARLDPIFRAMAPGVDAAPRTPGREGDTGTAEEGYLHCGPAGAGHFVKMIHNGIEYGAMAAYAEGLAILEKADLGSDDQVHDAETAPLADPEAYRYHLDIPEITELWRRGSVIASWLLDLTAAAFHEDPGLDSFAGSVSDSGEGRWTVQAAVDTGVPAYVLSAALFERFSSRGEGTYAGKVLSAMRRQFGGHAERPPDHSSE